MEDIWLTGTAAYASVGFFRKTECTFDYLHFFPVVALEIACKNILEFRFDNAVFLFGAELFSFQIHCRSVVFSPALSY